MMRTLKILLILTIGLYSMMGYTSGVHNFAPAVTMEVELPSNDPQIFSNFLLWRVKGSCEVVSESQKNPMSFKMQKNRGSLNNVEFVEGDSLYIVAESGQKFDLIAEARAKIEVINHGENLVILRCTNT